METMSERLGELGAKEDTVGYLLYLDLPFFFLFFSFSVIPMQFSRNCEPSSF